MRWRSACSQASRGFLGCPLAQGGIPKVSCVKVSRMLIRCSGKSRLHNTGGRLMRDATGPSASLLGEQLTLRRYPRAAQGDATGVATRQSPRLTPLSDTSSGCVMYLASNQTGGLLKQRLVDLGFIKGTPLRLIRKGPGGNLIAVQVRNTVIALRSEEARHLLVAPEPSSSPVSRE